MTTTKLIDDLKKLESTTKIQKIIENALKFKYHDFKSNIPFPKIQLSSDLIVAKVDTSIIKKVRNGDYDDDDDDENSQFEYFD